MYLRSGAMDEFHFPILPDYYYILKQLKGGKAIPLQNYCTSGLTSRKKTSFFLKQKILNNDYIILEFKLSLTYTFYLFIMVSFIINKLDQEYFSILEDIKYYLILKSGWHTLFIWMHVATVAFFKQ
jgi:hypothetical protein